MHRLERLLAHTTLRSDLGDSEWTSWLCVKAYGCVPILFTLLLALKGCLWKLHVCRPVHKDVVFGRLFHKFSHVCHQCLLGPYRLYVKHVHVCHPCSFGCLPLQVVCGTCACVPTLLTRLLHWGAVCQIYACHHCSLGPGGCSLGCWPGGCLSKFRMSAITVHSAQEGCLSNICMCAIAICLALAVCQT